MGHKEKLLFQIIFLVTFLRGTLLGSAPRSCRVTVYHRLAVSGLGTRLGLTLTIVSPSIITPHLTLLILAWHNIREYMNAAHSRS